MSEGGSAFPDYLPSKGLTVVLLQVMSVELFQLCKCKRESNQTYCAQSQEAGLDLPDQDR